jgi:flagellar hook assembly protein FlgD
VLELSLDLNKPARVSLEVMDGTGYVAATLLRNRRRTARTHMFHWDGYDDYGRPVRPGEYTVQATAGSPPIRVTSAVQVTIQEDAFVHRQLEQQPVLRGRRNLDSQEDAAGRRM